LRHDNCYQDAGCICVAIYEGADLSEPTQLHSGDDTISLALNLSLGMHEFACICRCGQNNCPISFHVSTSSDVEISLDKSQPFDGFDWIEDLSINSCSMKRKFHERADHEATLRDSLFQLLDSHSVS
jgi:hypothetical protein